MIQELNETVMEEIFQKHMIFDFPKEELKPLPVMRQLTAEGRYRGFGSYDGDRLEAYAFLGHEKESPIYLLDYFAVCRGGRGKGVGSRFLKKLFAVLEPEFLILEVEDADHAANEEEYKIRCRRLDFYHRNGVRNTGLSARMFGVDMVILYLAREDLGPETDRKVYDSLDAIYQQFFRKLYTDGTVSLTEPM